MIVSNGAQSGCSSLMTFSYNYHMGGGAPNKAPRTTDCYHSSFDEVTSIKPRTAITSRVSRSRAAAFPSIHGDFLRLAQCRFDPSAQRSISTPFGFDCQVPTMP
jgi:hypothetical protein